MRPTNGPCVSAWCIRTDGQRLPATPETIAGWMTSLAKGYDGKPRRAQPWRSIWRGRCLPPTAQAGHGFDRKNPIIAETWDGHG